MNQSINESINQSIAINQGKPHDEQQILLKYIPMMNEQ